MSSFHPPVFEIEFSSTENEVSILDAVLINEFCRFKSSYYSLRETGLLFDYLRLISSSATFEALLRNGFVAACLGSQYTQQQKFYVRTHRCGCCRPISVAISIEESLYKLFDILLQPLELPAPVARPTKHVPLKRH